jgi:hypothetical protein
MSTGVTWQKIVLSVTVIITFGEDQLQASPTEVVALKATEMFIIEEICSAHSRTGQTNT